MLDAVEPSPRVLPVREEPADEDCCPFCLEYFEAPIGSEADFLALSTILLFPSLPLLTTILEVVLLARSEQGTNSSSSMLDSFDFFSAGGLSLSSDEFPLEVADDWSDALCSDDDAQEAAFLRFL